MQTRITKHSVKMLEERGITKDACYLALKYGDCILSNRTNIPKSNIQNSQYRSIYEITYDSISKARKDGVEIPDFFIGIRIILSVDNYIISAIDRNTPSR